MASLLTAVVLVVVATAVVWKGAELLETAGNNLAVHYGLPPVVQGAIVAAVGSSFPELSVSVISVLLHGKFDLGIGVIVGSAIFNILVIPGLSALFADDLRASRDVVYKEAQFYMLSVAVLLLVLSLGVIYNPVEGARLEARVTRPMALIPVALYGLYVFIQYADTAEYDAAESGRSDNVLRQWGALLAGLALVLVAVEGFVHSAELFGALFGTPEALWGLTVVAAATSLPDALVSVRAAQRGRGVTSLSNVFGSNVFDLLVAVPAGILLAGSAVFDYAVAVPMMGFLTLATIILFTTLRTDLELSEREAWLLLAAYAVFLGWMVLETLGVTSLVPGV